MTAQCTQTEFGRVALVLDTGAQLAHLYGAFRPAKQTVKKPSSDYESCRRMPFVRYA